MSLPWFLSAPDPSIYLGDNYLVLDFETTNIEHGSPYAEANRILLARWVHGKDHPKGGHTDIRSKWASEFEQSELLEDIERADFIVAHFTKFELGWLARCGADLRKILPYCTQIGEYVIAGNRDLPGGLGLEATCERYGFPGKDKFIARCIGAGICPSELPASHLERYCGTDITRTHSVFLRQRQTLRELGLLPVAYCRNVVTPCLADIEPRGMCLDKERVEAKHKDLSGQYNALLEQFEKVTGGINSRSGQQMREYLYTKLGFAEVLDHRGNPLRTKGGKKGKPQPRTDKKVLPLLKATTPEQKEFKQLAIGLAKLKVPVGNLEKMKKILKTGERIVYASIDQTITDTHRFSSSGRRGGFQFHNFDRAFKPLFRSREDGHVVVEADAPQLEFRVATHLGDDPVAKLDICIGVDVHALTSAVIGVSRQDAKSHTFKPLYGGKSGTAKEKAYYAAFRAKYPDIYKTQDSWTWEVAKTKKLRIASGLIFYWPDTEVRSGNYISNTPTIFNYPIQSFATADIIPLTLALVWHEIATLDAFIVNTIHDSIVLECPPSQLDALVDILVECFTSKIYDVLRSLYGIEFSVPLGVGIKAAEHWAEGEERKFEPRNG